MILTVEYTVIMKLATKKRCAWAEKGSELDMLYHDKEWGVPLHDDRLLFEFLILEGAQAGLSWSTILKKRNNYRKAFDNFNAEKVARYDAKKIAQLLKNEGLIRNRLKIAGTVQNAKAFLKIQKEFGSFDQYIWQFAKKKAFETMSKELKKRGFTFVGPTICYAFMQATGMVNDHAADCFRHK